MPATRQAADETEVTTINIDELPNAGEIYFTQSMCDYLQFDTPAEFRKFILKYFEGQDSKNLYSTFTSTRDVAELDDLIYKIKDFILSIGQAMTLNIFNIFLQKQREQESEQKLRAQVKAERIHAETKTVNDMIAKEDAISAPKMKDFIQEEAQNAFQKLQNETNKNANRNTNKRKNTIYPPPNVNINNNNNVSGLTTPTSTTNNTEKNNNKRQRLGLNNHNNHNNNY